MSASTETNTARREVISISSQPRPATNELTVDEVKSLNTNPLFDWIQKSLTNPLDDEDKEAFFKSKINGGAFLNHAGDVKFFMSAGISFGFSDNLAELAKKLA